MLSAFVLIGSTLLAVHTITCAWFFTGTYFEWQDTAQKLDGLVGPYHVVPGTDSRGWVEEVFDGTNRLCQCHTNSTNTTGRPSGAMHFDSFEKRCVNTTDADAPTLPPCFGVSTPSAWDYYTKSLHTAMSGDTAISDEYSNTVVEMLVSAVSTGVLGFMWVSAHQLPRL